MKISRKELSTHKIGLFHSGSVAVDIFPIFRFVVLGCIDVRAFVSICVVYGTFSLNMFFVFSFFSPSIVRVMNVDLVPE